MPKTLIHQITYPDGNSVPNVPVVMQAQAESTDRAISRVSEAPFIVCTKNAEQRIVPVEKWEAIKWDVETWKQGITHNTATDPDKFVIEEDGLYSITAKVSFIGERSIVGAIISVNGVIDNRTMADAVGQPYAHPKPVTITDLKLKAGDVVRVHGKGTQANTDIRPFECFFSMRKSAGYTQQGAK